MSIDISRFHQVFFEESREGLDIMEQGLLGLTRGEADTETLHAVFRAAHSIKGGSGTFGFTAIAEFTHSMETLLDQMRDGRRAITAQGVDLLLGAVDCLRELVGAAESGEVMDLKRIAGQREMLEQALVGNDSPAPTGTEAATPAVSEAGWTIRFTPRPQLLRSGNDPLRLLRTLSELGELEVQVDTTALPAMDELDPEVCHLSWALVLRGAVERAEIDDLFAWVEDDCDLDIRPLSAVAAEISRSSACDQPEPVQSAPSQSDSRELVPLERRRGADRRRIPERRNGDRRAGTSGGGSIRVDIDKIDSLINMVGELVITQSMLSLLGEGFSMDRLQRLRAGLAQLERHSRDLQESVMRIRMLPIGFVFNRFPRLVHDLSAQLGKKVELRISGEQTELDKTVIEQIGDPLVHLLRNSLDHGIEPPEARRAAGKPETGVVALSARQQGGSIVIEIADDGAGLNRERILRKAVEKGLVGDDEELSDDRVYDLIMQPGFSTAETVSDVSGRGVGMDVVRKNIQGLSGSLEIQSEPGRGSIFTVRLPLTLAIMDGQSVTIGDESYIVPLMSIVESIQVKPQQTTQVAGQGEVIRLRDDYVPIIRLAEVLGVESARARAPHEGLLVVVEGDNNRRCGLLVDSLAGQQQVVIKSLESNFRRMDGISGATILGDGAVALILDIPGVMRLAAA